MPIRETDIQIGFNIDNAALDKLEAKLNKLFSSIDKNGFDGVESDARGFVSTLKTVEGGLSKVSTAASKVSAAASKAFGKISAAASKTTAFQKLSAQANKARDAFSKISTPFNTLASKVKSVGSTIANKFSSLGGSAKTFGSKVTGLKESFNKLKTGAETAGGKIKSVFQNSVTGAIMKAQAALGLLKTGFSKLGSAVTGVFQNAMNMEQSQLSIEALAGSGEEATKIFNMLNKKGQTSAFSEQEFLKAGQSLMSLTKNFDDLETGANVIERLAASNPAAGFDQAIFSMKEFLTGDYTSIVDAFNMDRSSVKAALEGADTVQERMAALDGLLKNMGFDDSYIQKMNQSTAAQLDNLKSNISMTFTNAGMEVLNGLKPAMTGLQNWLNSGALESLGEKLGNAAQWGLDKLKVAYQWFQDNDIMGKLGEAWNRTKPIFQAVGSFITDTLGAVWDNLKKLWEDENFQKILDKLQEFGGYLIDQIGPTLEKVGGWIEKAFSWITDNWELVVAALAGIVAGFIAFKIAMIITNITALIPLIASVWSFTAALLANPITWIVIAIGLLIAAIVLLALKWDWVKEKWGQLCDYLKEKWNTFTTWITEKFNTFKEFFVGIWNKIKFTVMGYVHDLVIGAVQKIMYMRQRLSEIINQVKTFFSDTWENIKEKTSQKFEEIVEKIRTKLDEIKQFFKELPENIAQKLKDGKKALKQAIADVINGMLDKLASGVNKITGGINWVLDKIGVDKENQIPEWDPPEFLAKGTKKHKGGPAIVGEKGRELVALPNGKVGMVGQNGPQYINLPKGAAVLPNKQTEQMVGAAGYESGVGDFFHNIGSSIKDAIDKAIDVMSYIGKPKELLDAVWEKIGIGEIKGAGVIVEMMKTGIKKIKDSAVEWIRGKLDKFGAESLAITSGASSVNITGGAAAWRGEILRAAKQMGETVSERELNGIIAQIQRESGGNQSIVQSPAVYDENIRKGTPARGLLQYVPSTFAAYAVPGYTNIMDGYHQLLAFFNNTTWRQNLPYGRSGWSPHGARKMANGGIVNKPTSALIGEAGTEAVIPLAGKAMFPFAAAIAANIASMASGYNAQPLYESNSVTPSRSSSAGYETNNITININGASNATETGQKVVQALEEYFGSFNRRNPRTREV